jgi:hypothetical protein
MGRVNSLSRINPFKLQKLYSVVTILAGNIFVRKISLTPHLFIQVISVVTKESSLDNIYLKIDAGLTNPRENR